MYSVCMDPSKGLGFRSFNSGKGRKSEIDEIFLPPGRGERELGVVLLIDKMSVF